MSVDCARQLFGLVLLLLAIIIKVVLARGVEFLFTVFWDVLTNETLPLSLGLDVWDGLQAGHWVHIDFTCKRGIRSWDLLLRLRWL